MNLGRPFCLQPCELRKRVLGRQDWEIPSEPHPQGFSQAELLARFTQNSLELAHFIPDSSETCTLLADPFPWNSPVCSREPKIITKREARG